MNQILTVEQWMQRKRDTEGAEGLWRIGDELYDLTYWIDQHPGGADWIKLTRGTDITEAFESHHITTKAEEILPKFHVRNASTPRAYPYTFHKDGFYRTLKSKVRNKLQNRSEGPLLKSMIIMDSLVLLTISLCVLTAKTQNYIIGNIAGFFLALTAICSHNFFHLRDNWRMYYFHLSLLSINDWRISHILSHHIYTNTSEDLEIVLFHPFFQWLPKTNKHWLAKYFSPFYSPLIYMFTIPKEALQRLIIKNISLSELLALVIPLLMIIFGAQNIKIVLIHWMWIISSCSLYFVAVGVTAAHHHPEIYHEGDAHRKDQDWGLHQLDTVRERIEIKGNSLLALISFGDHSLHHLFPSLDHSILPHLYPQLEETCAEFGVHLKLLSTWDLVRGQFKQLGRSELNSNPPE